MLDRAISIRPRRTLLIALCGGVLGLRVELASTQLARKPVVVLTGGSGPPVARSTGLVAAFKEALRGLGWVEKCDVIHVRRFCEDDHRKAELLSAALAKEQVAVIFVSACRMRFSRGPIA